jgi:inhibitor of Bruton tyrosine kinase
LIIHKKKLAQLYAMCGRNVVSISAGKHWTAAVTVTGEVFMWDGKKNKEAPSVSRLHGIKQASSVCVGETHLLAVCSLYHPAYPPKAQKPDLKKKSELSDKLQELDEDMLSIDVHTKESVVGAEDDMATKRAPTLKNLCEKIAIEFLLEPRSSIELMEIADSLDAPDLRKHCEVLSFCKIFLYLSSYSVSPCSLIFYLEFCSCNCKINSQLFIYFIPGNGNTQP